MGDAKLATLLDTAEKSGEPLRIVVGEMTYDVIVRSRQHAPDPWAEYDPEAALEALEESAGVLEGIDPDTLIADMKAARDQHDLT